MELIFNSDVVTVFNRHYDVVAEREIWLPTLLSNTNLVVTKGANVSTSGLSDADTARLYVDLDDLPKPYIKPVKWGLQTLVEKQNSITFTPQIDFFVAGDLTDVEVLEEGFFEWVRKHYDDVFLVTNVDAYTKVMPHLEVGGK